MYIKITHYGYFEKDGQQVYGLFCGHLPVGVTVEKELEILYPEENCILVNKITGNEHSVVYLKDADCEDNYIEKEINNNANNTIN